MYLLMLLIQYNLLKKKNFLRLTWGPHYGVIMATGVEYLHNILLYGGTQWQSATILVICPRICYVHETLYCRRH